MSPISHLIVNITQQKLYALDAQNKLQCEYAISSSRFGVGNQNGSFKTPLGEHSIAQKIGAGCAADEVFIGRQPQGQLAALMDSMQALPEDIITARILRLQGQQDGINKGEGIDSYQRYIYIHGTADETTIGRPMSHGCIRMFNQDVIELYDLVDEGCRVTIEK